MRWCATPPANTNCQTAPGTRPIARSGDALAIYLARWLAEASAVEPAVLERWSVHGATATLRRALDHYEVPKP